MTIGQKVAGAAFMSLLASALNQPEFNWCQADQMLTTVLPAALDSVFETLTGDLFSCYTKDYVEEGTKPIIWPSDPILNHHLRKLVSTTISAIVDHTSTCCPAVDHIHLTAFCRRLDDAWMMVAGLSSRDAVDLTMRGYSIKMASTKAYELAEDQIASLLSGDLEDLAARKPLSREEWKILLRDLVLLCSVDKEREVVLSDETYEILSANLEESFILGVFSALCHKSDDAEAAYKKVQILKANQLLKELEQRFVGLRRDILPQLENHQEQMTRLQESLGRIQDQLRLDSTPPSKDFPQPKRRGEISDFWFHQEWTSFQGRLKEIDALKRFLNDPQSKGVIQKFRWGVLLGQAGSGKSRLALHVGKDAEARLAGEKPDGWQMLYLRSPGNGGTFNGWTTWRPEFPTLVIIDYAASRKEDVWSIIRTLARRGEALGAGSLSKPVRVLLLERSAAQSLLQNGFEELEGEPEFVWVNRSHHRFNAGPIVSDKLGPLVLPPLDDFTLSRLLFQVYQDKGGKGMSCHPMVFVERLRGIRHDSRPLFAMLLGSRLAEDLEATDLRPYELATWLLTQEHRRWKKYKRDHPELDEKVLHLLSLVCICDELEFKRATNTDLDFLPSTEHIEDLCHIVFSYGGGYRDGVLTALKPDYLRELYVLLRLSQGEFPLSENCEAVKRHTKDLIRYIAQHEEYYPMKPFVTNAAQSFPALTTQDLIPLWVRADA